jgi:hypothetical protein
LQQKRQLKLQERELQARQNGHSNGKLPNGKPLNGKHLNGQHLNGNGQPKVAYKKSAAAKSRRSMKPETSMEPGAFATAVGPDQQASA